MGDAPERMLVTSALPYANGPIHIGHLVEYIQTDIWVRFQKLRGRDCIYVCADDTHGTPVMISAKKAGITPEKLIETMNREHQEDFQKFFVHFDNYYTTNSPENRELSEFIYGKMREHGHIAEREIEQFFCEHDGMFLPDRFIRGTCPRCGALDQYGDTCEACSSTYDPTELSDPVCAECKHTPVRKKTVHYFFRLGDFTEKLKVWTSGEHLQPEVRNKLNEWFEQGLRDWDISRDAPYFGFRIPGSQDKYFYVWLDAPVGYMASTKNWSTKNGKDFDSYWRSPDTEIYHFIGKDIMYFHCLFWPAMLMCAGFSCPTKVFIHGFLTVDGEKMSKSRGTFIKAETFAKHIPPEYLRYYYACKMGSGVGDIDLNMTDFVARVNSDILGKIANLGFRVGSMLGRNLEGRCGVISPEDREFVASIAASSEAIASHYERLEYQRAMKEICRLADCANKFLEDKAPWTTVKSDHELTRSTLTAALEAFRLITLYIKPVLPRFAEQVERYLSVPPLVWNDVGRSVENSLIEKFDHLAQKIEKEHIDKVVEESLNEHGTSKEVKAQAPALDEPMAPECTIEDFSKVDLRVAKVLKAEHVEGADTLLRLVLDIGGIERTVFAGIKSAYKPEELEGRLVIAVANLKPRKMRFGTSEGMVLASGKGGSEIFLLKPDSGALPGQRIH
ncbi:MAG: methionine--tRNA ligase [Candidatus Eremiobacteraeota bacterium]|nr:methionine--tRNA ligase [Candidatus Eremiobacteraeota bacterium]